jgi:transposase
MESITLSKVQQRRAEVLGRLDAGSISKDEAQFLLGLSRRQVDRILARYRVSGLESVVHGNTGKAPVNKTEESVVDRVLPLVREDGKYHGFNVCHICDLLAENEQITIGRSTLDRLLRDQKIITAKKPKQVRRKRRQRASAEGLLLQIDGSPHYWLEGRGAKMSLMGAIDDATGKIVYAQFRPTEDLAGYLMMLRSIATNYGLPESIYHDRHTILHSPKAATIDDELAGEEPMSQFQRALHELGIASIPAGSPQAKGRVERLWETLQDRLVKEMRLKGISNIDGANAFLGGFVQRFNKRFAVEAVNSEVAWVKPERRLDLAYFFCAKESRKVKDDHTISYLGKTLQILPTNNGVSLAGKWVKVHVTPEEELFVYHGKKRLKYEQVKKPVKTEAVPECAPKPDKQPDPESIARRRAWLFASIEAA